MSEPRPLPPWVGERGFITVAEWNAFGSAEQGEWVQFAADVDWLLDQPQFRRFSFAFLNEARFCGTDRSPLRGSVEETHHAIGIQDAGRMMRLVLQSVAPRKWMKTMHEAFNAVSRMLPPGGKE